MFKKFIRLFQTRTARKTDFSDFFRNAPEDEKKRVMLEAARRANQEQKELVEQYRRLRTKVS